MIQTHIDLETYSEADIKKVGAWKYSEHPSTEVICMAFAYDDYPPELWIPRTAPNFKLGPLFDTNHQLHAWNSFFEYCIIKNTLRATNIPPISQWTDTMAVAAYNGWPMSLEKCGEAMRLGADEAKSKRGKALINKFCKPYRGRRVTDGIEELHNYCLQDVVAERNISKRLSPMIPMERKVWELDQEINIRGIEMDVSNIENAIEIYGQAQESNMAKLQEITGLKNPNSQQQFLGWLKDQGYPNDNIQAQTLREFLKEREHARSGNKAEVIAC